MHSLTTPAIATGQKRRLTPGRERWIGSAAIWGNRSLWLLFGLLLVTACQPAINSSPAGGVSTAVPTATATPRPPTATPSPTHTPTPRPTYTPTPAPQPLTTLPEEEEDVPFPASYILVLSEGDMNQLIQRGLSTQANIPLTDGSVDLQPGQIVIRGQVRIGFIPVEMEMVVTIPVVNSRPAPEIQAIRVRGRDLGEPLRSSILNLVTPYLDQLAQADLKVDIETVTITDEEIRFVGRYKE